MRPGILIISAVFWALPIGAIRAEGDVIDSAPNGFTIRNSVDIAAQPDKVYYVLWKDIAAWWDSSHTFSGDAANLSLDARPGGCFCERFPDGGGVRHMSVVYAEPGKTLRMTGGLGPLQEFAVAGSLTFRLTGSGNSTKVELTYRVGGYQDGGLAAFAAPVDSVLRGQLLRLARYVETGNPRVP